MNEHLGACSALARLLFVGLWTEADRDGVLEDRPARLAAKLLPYDGADGEALLSELAGQVEPGGAPALIRRYEVQGRRMVHICNWRRHQSPHPKEPGNGLPRLTCGEALPQHADEGLSAPSRKAPRGNGLQKPRQATASHGKQQTSPSYFLNPRSPVIQADTDRPEGVGLSPIGSVIGSVIGGLTRDAGDEGLLRRIKRLAKHDPERPPTSAWGAWWRSVLPLLVEADGVGALFGHVEYAEKCCDPKQRAMKDLGELRAPHKWLVKQACAEMKSRQVRWPAFPSQG